MTVTITNETNFPIDVWLNIAGGPKYWDNNMQPGVSNEHHPGFVWYDLNAKINTGPEHEITEWQAAIQGALPFWGLAGVVITTLAKTGIIRQGDLPDNVKQMLNDEAIEYTQGVEIKGTEWTNIYGTDKRFAVRGGHIDYSVEDGKVKIQSIEPLRLEKTEG